MKKATLTSTYLIAIAISLCSCGSNNESSNFKLDLGGENRNINEHTLVRDTTNPANRFCRIDSTSPYGYGWEGYLSESFQNKKVKVVVSGKLRSTEDVKGALVAGITCNGENKFYASFSADKYITELNKWCEFRDSIYIESSFMNTSPLQFSTYLFKPDGKGYLDMDDVMYKVEIIE